MNISKILLVFVLALSIVSCKKEDDGVIPFVFNQTNLEGTYELNYYKSTETETIQFNGAEIVSVTTTTGDTFGINVTFLENRTYITDGAYREVFTTVVGGQTTMEGSDIIVEDNITRSYSVSSGTSRLTLDGDIYEVPSFSETGMTITFENTETDSNGDTTVFNEEFRFTKI